MAAKISGGRDETGESELRRSLNVRMDSANDLISASIACCWYSREFAWVGFIKKANGVTVLVLPTYVLSAVINIGFRTQTDYLFLELELEHPNTSAIFRFDLPTVYSVVNVLVAEFDGPRSRSHDEEAIDENPIAKPIAG